MPLRPTGLATSLFMRGYLSEVAMWQVFEARGQSRAGGPPSRTPSLRSRTRTARAVLPQRRLASTWQRFYELVHVRLFCGRTDSELPTRTWDFFAHQALQLLSFLRRRLQRRFPRSTKLSALKVHCSRLQLCCGELTDRLRAVYPRDEGSGAQIVPSSALGAKPFTTAYGTEMTLVSIQRCSECIQENVN